MPGEECAQHGRLLDTLDKIMSNLEEIKKAMGEGNGRFQLIEYKVEELEEKIKNMQGTVERRTKKFADKVWDISKMIIVLIIGMLFTYTVDGIKVSLKDKETKHAQQQKEIHP